MNKHQNQNSDPVVPPANLPQPFEQGIEMHPVKIGEYTSAHLQGREPGSLESRIEAIRRVHHELGAQTVVASMNGHNSKSANRHNSEVTRARFGYGASSRDRNDTSDYIQSVVAYYPVRRTRIFDRSEND